MIINYEYDPNIYQKLKLEKDRNIKNGFYQYIQIQFSYNSNHIEGSTLTPEQTESIFDRGEISGKAKVDEVLETANHYKMFDYLLDTISEPLTNTLIKELHLRLRNGIDEDAGNYKKFQNQIGSINPISTTNVKDVPAAIDKLLASYNCIDSVSLENIAAFHSEFEKIHPFQDGNGRTGRAIMFRECIRNGIMPFVVYDIYRKPYESGLNEWRKGNKQQLLETLNACQEVFNQNYRYFIGIENTLITPTYTERQFNDKTEINNSTTDEPDPTDSTESCDI